MKERDESRPCELATNLKKQEAHRPHCSPEQQ